MTKKILPLVAVTALVWSGFAVGCTPEARQDVKEAGQNVGDATTKSAEGTVEAGQKAGAAVKEGVKETGEAVGGAAKAAGTAVKNGTEAAGEAVGGAAKAAGTAVKNGTEAAGEAVGGAAKGVAKVGVAMDLTPAVKNALIVDKSIDGSTINVDTKPDKKQVIIRGTVKSDAEKSKATQIAKAKLAEKGSDYSIVNQLTIKK